MCIKFFSIKAVIYKLGEPPKLVLFGVKFFKFYFICIPVNHEIIITFYGDVKRIYTRPSSVSRPGRDYVTESHLFMVSLRTTKL